MRGPHDDAGGLGHGPPPGRASAGMVLVHGRGGTAEEMIALAGSFAAPGLSCIAPRARGGSWYPNSFLAPLAANEPGLSSGLSAIGRAVAGLVESGLARQRIVLLGFSQGACLTLEYAARTGGVRGGVVALSGALIGSGARPGAVAPDDKLFDYGETLAGTPVFLGCNEVDPHIPLARVQESARVFRALGATVTERIYPGAGHGVYEDEIRWVRDLVSGLPAA